MLLQLQGWNCCKSHRRLTRHSHIAYHLQLLGGEPLIMATIGEDGAPYTYRMDKLGLERTHVREIKDSMTAQAFITTDLDDNQITAFHPGAMGMSEQNHVGDAKDVSLGIVSPDGRATPYLVFDEKLVGKPMMPFLGFYAPDHSQWKPYAGEYIVMTRATTYSDAHKPEMTFDYWRIDPKGPGVEKIPRITWRPGPIAPRSPAPRSIFTSTAAPGAKAAQPPAPTSPKFSATPAPRSTGISACSTPIRATMRSSHSSMN